MRKLIRFFPKEVGVPYRLAAASMKEMLKIVNKKNAINTIYFSLYDWMGDKNYDMCKIDKIFFDLDKEDAFSSLIKLHNYCMKEDLNHFMLFTGRRFQFHVFTKNYDKIENKKSCLKNVQKYIAGKVGLTIGDEKECDIDHHIIGDIARLARFPNTMHIKTSLYSIPLTIEDIKLGEMHIKEKARKQCFDFKYYGNKYFDIKKFDIKADNNNIELDTTGNFIKGIKIDDLLPCMQKALKEPKFATNKVRFYFAKCCREMLVDPEDCDKLAREYWSDVLDSTGKKSKYQEFVAEKQIEYAYGNDNTFFPSCNLIKKMGLCDKDCGKQLYK